MKVPVVQVGKVTMGMRLPSMLMNVRVPRRGGESRMRVVVVAIVVSMTVDVLHGLVRMFVLVLVENEKDDSDSEEQGGPHMLPRELFTQEQEGEARTKEGSA
jgi:hypothetical protein